jgi:selenocysteine lyase/cysteine desulfurase
MVTITVSQPAKRTTPSRPRLIGGKREVPLLNGEYVRSVNLDSAASTAPLVQVQRVVEDFLPWYASVHRGTGYKSRLCTHLYDQAREVVTRFVGADPSTHTVVFVRNTTEALNLLAHRMVLKSDGIVLTTSLEHHSNLLPWYRHPHELIELTPTGRLDLDDLERRLKRHQGKVELVTVSGASNVTGLLPDIRSIARLAHAHGALLAVDAAQLAPHRPFSMGRLDDPDHTDVVAFSGHKLYAPYGSGALVVPSRLLAEGEPMLVGGGTVGLLTRSGISWATGPDLEEAGSPNVVGVVAMSAALEALMHFGMQRVASHERELTRYAVRRLQEIPGLTLYGPSWETVLAGTEDRLGVFSFNLEGHTYNEVASILAHEWGIAVRTGCFCAHLYVAHLLGIAQEEANEARGRLSAGLPVELPGMVRASLGLGNTKEDIDRLVCGLEAIARGDIGGTYIKTAQGDVEPATFAQEIVSHGRRLFSPIARSYL